jgi:hypothetical protein
MLGIEILIKKNYHPTTFLNGLQIKPSSIPDFSLAKNRRPEWLSRVLMRYKKLLESKKIYRKQFLSKYLSK